MKRILTVLALGLVAGITVYAAKTNPQVLTGLEGRTRKDIHKTAKAIRKQQKGAIKRAKGTIKKAKP